MAVGTPSEVLGIIVDRASAVVACVGDPVTDTVEGSIPFGDGVGLLIFVKEDEDWTDLRLAVLL